MDQEGALHEFCKKFVVEEKLAASYLQHLKDLELKKRKREESRRQKKLEEQAKTNESYDWVELYRGGLLKKLTVSTLELYLAKHNINCAEGLLKQDKLDIVCANIARSLVERLSHDEEDKESEEEDDDDEIDGDVVLEEIGDDSESEEECNDDDSDDRWWWWWW